MDFYCFIPPKNMKESVHYYYYCFQTLLLTCHDALYFILVYQSKEADYNCTPQFV